MCIRDSPDVGPIERYPKEVGAEGVGIGRDVVGVVVSGGVVRSGEIESDSVGSVRNDASFHATDHFRDVRWCVDNDREC